MHIGTCMEVDKRLYYCCKAHQNAPLQLLPGIESSNRQESWPHLTRDLDDNLSDSMSILFVYYFIPVKLGGYLGARLVGCLPLRPSLLLSCPWLPPSSTVPWAPWCCWSDRSSRRCPDTAAVSCLHGQVASKTQIERASLFARMREHNGPVQYFIETHTYVLLTCCEASHVGVRLFVY